MTLQSVIIQERFFFANIASQISVFVKGLNKANSSFRCALIQRLSLSIQLVYRPCSPTLRLAAGYKEKSTDLEIKNLSWTVCVTCWFFIFKQSILPNLNLVSHRSWMEIALIIMKCHVLGRVWLSVTPWTIARQTPLFMGFSQQEYWRRLPFPPAEDLQESNPQLLYLLHCR